jgi:L-2-hydroxyglutarate oxidase LhgO
VHAGFYYSPYSLKAKFCADGNREIRKIAKAGHIPLVESGKVVVTKNEQEEASLDVLALRAAKNGVEVEILNHEELHSIEPQAKTFRNFLWSPTTAISDPKALTEYLFDNFLSKGGKVQFSGEISLIKNQNQVLALCDQKAIPAKRIINAAGAGSLALAQQVGVGLQYVVVPFIGKYLKTSGNVNTPKRLIYPVPHAINPFLGIHTTTTIEGELKIGPTALPVLGAESYKLSDLPKWHEITKTIYGLTIMLKNGSKNGTFSILKDLPTSTKNGSLREVSKIYPGVYGNKTWRRVSAGIRAQLLDTTNGNFIQDFIVTSELNVTHLLNIVSPGWTSSIPFSRWISHQLDA